MTIAEADAPQHDEDSWVPWGEIQFEEFEGPVPGTWVVATEYAGRSCVMTYTIGHPELPCCEGVWADKEWACGLPPDHDGPHGGEWTPL